MAFTVFAVLHKAPPAGSYMNIHICKTGGLQFRAAKGQAVQCERGSASAVSVCGVCASLDSHGPRSGDSRLCPASQGASEVNIHPPFTVLPKTQKYYLADNQSRLKLANFECFQWFTSGQVVLRMYSSSTLHVGLVPPQFKQSPIAPHTPQGIFDQAGRGPGGSQNK